MKSNQLLIPVIALAFAVAPLSQAQEATKSAADATKDAPYVNTLGMKFAPVPIKGGPTDGRVILFSIAETRVQDYERFARETKREWPKPDFEQGPTHPAVNLIWDDAAAFCIWLTEQEMKTGRLGLKDAYRLPSDHEWSCAAGIGDREDANLSPQEKRDKLPKVYPWGDSWPPPPGQGNFGDAARMKKFPAFQSSLERIAHYDDGFADTAPVMSFKPNALGLYDLDGNVTEWCADWFNDKHLAHVHRGGSFLHDYEKLESSRRGYDGTGTRYGSIGFRVVLEVTKP